MKYVICVIGILFLSACTTTNPSLQPIQSVGCDAETAVTTAMAGTIATTLNCSNQAAIQSSLQVALGNVNFCAQATAAQAQAKLKKVFSKGIVADLACPIVVNVLIGYGTSSVPTVWGCSTSTNASTLSAALTSACELAPF